VQPMSMRGELLDQTRSGPQQTSGDGKASQATRKQAIDLQQAILFGLRKRDGGAVVGEGSSMRWRLASL
jgi:hypothetical protein